QAKVSLRGIALRAPLLDLEQREIDRRAGALQPAARLDSDHEHLDDLERSGLAARGAGLGAAHVGHRRKRTGGRVARSIIDSSDRGLRVLFEEERKALRLFAGVADHPDPGLDLMRLRGRAKYQHRYGKTKRKGHAGHA